MSISVAARAGLAGWLLGFAVVSTVFAQGQNGVVFDGVNVVPMDAERVLRDQRVVVADGRIQAIGAASAIEVPEGYERIEAQGAYLLPGLAEMHAHVPPDPNDREFAEDVLLLYVANGITTARSMLGHEWHLGLQQEIDAGETLGPRLITSGPSFSGGSVSSPEQAREMVRAQAEAGYDFLKVHPGLSREEFDAMAEAAQEAGIEFAGHVPADVGLERALEAGIASVDHLDGYVQALAPEVPAGTAEGFFGYGVLPWVEEERIALLAEKTRDAGAWVVPTETLMVNMMSEESPEALADRPEMAYLPQNMIQGWVNSKRNFIDGEAYEPEQAQRYLELRARLLMALHEAGAGIVLGSDAPQVFNVPGFSIHREMQLMAEAGMTPYEVLVTGTVNAARYFGAEDEFGRVAVGLDADLILVDGNPLEDLAALENPRGVMLRGRFIDRETLEQRLDALRRD